MYAISTAFLQMLQSGSQRSFVRADVLSGGAPVAATLKVTGGSVTVDGTAAVRRRCSITVVDETGLLIPKGSGDVLSPYGYELRLWRGFGLDAGNEVVPLGTFRIASAKVTDAGARTLAIEGYDRSRQVSRARFEAPYAVAAGSNYITAIQNLITSRLAGTTFNSITNPSTTPVLVFDEAADPWKAATDMAQSIGAEVFFDPMGVCVIRMQPNTASDPLSYTYDDSSISIMLSVENTLTDDPGYNGVVVDGEAPGVAPVRSVQYDTDPNSPTYYLGRYGKVPTFVKSQYITTQAQADDAALAELRRLKGGTEALGFTAVPNPAHEAGDVVRVVRSAIGVDSYYLVESFTAPLDSASDMSITTRKRRTA